MFLELHDIEVDCIIGELVYEREQPQTLHVDLRLELPDAVAETDALDATVDYVAIGESIRRELQKARCRMIERAAYLTVRCVMQDPKILGCVARVEKVGAVKGLKSAIAEYRMNR